MQKKINDNFILKNGGYSNYEDSIELARHRWYYYKEGFSPNFVKKAIEHSGVSKDEIIIDPFNGSGTTTLTASLAGYKSIGIEVNPFTSFLASTKNKNVDVKHLKRLKDELFKKCKKGSQSSLVGYSTFTEKDGVEKWLFNTDVLNAFEAGWQFASRLLLNNDVEDLLKLVLITSAMNNCNAVKDGKCLRYRQTWKNYGYNIETFLESLNKGIDNIIEDISKSIVNVDSEIINGDVRTILDNDCIKKFKLCVTSPPYLNTFDYTDIYRPELFLGKFITNSQDLYNLRLKTVRSHIQAKWDKPSTTQFGSLYQQTIKHVNENKALLMHKDIPLMIQAYFEDMNNILKKLKAKAEEKAQLWLVVSNSAYAGYEIPVDLIIADIGSRAGWNLKEIGVLRQVQKRKTKYSPDILELRESVIILENANKKS